MAVAKKIHADIVQKHFMTNVQVEESWTSKKNAILVNG